MPTQKLTKDGYEGMLGTHHYGHFLRCGLLFPRLEERNSHIVMVSSLGYNMGIKTIQFDDMNWDHNYHPNKTYSQSASDLCLFQPTTERKHMEILKASTDWTKAEMLSSAFFVLSGVIFFLTSLGFWHLGKTDIAKAYVVPTSIAGALLLIIGLGLFFPSQTRVSSFPIAFNNDAAAFVASEIERADKILNDYRIAVFKVIPLIIAICAVLILYFESPIWRASLITTIAMMAVILIIDTNANARLEIYREKLSLASRPA